jgi:hypothetical protein
MYICMCVCVFVCVCVCVCVSVYIYLKQELKSRGLAECSAIISKKYKSRAAVEWLTAEAFLRTSNAFYSARRLYEIHATI